MKHLFFAGECLFHCFSATAMVQKGLKIARKVENKEYKSVVGQSIIYIKIVSQI